jgi:hypothetical protein
VGVVYVQISKLVTALSKCGALNDRSVRDAIAELAESLGDVDYQSHMLGEMAIKLAEARCHGDAEVLVRGLPGLEKSVFMTKLAEVEMEHGESNCALSLYEEACAAAMANRFPAQQAQAIAAVAKSAEKNILWEAAAKIWNEAVSPARAGQGGPGTDGPESAGVLVDAAEAFARHGDRKVAEQIAEWIVFDHFRELARQRLSSSS